MSKKLVVVESPAKAKTIGRILGKDYVVTSSVGHIRDLPEKSLGVDVEKSFAPKYVYLKGKKKVIDELRREAKRCDPIYLAPDPDREGEAIAWHIQEIIAETCPDKSFHRVEYNEITPRAVRAAFEHPGEINRDRVDAQQARRVLDRLVGYKVSPVLWRQVRRGLSAGRVQSVALRLVCEREVAIRDFVPEPYWIMGALARKVVVPLTPFMLKLMRIDDEKADIKSEEQATGILADLEGRSLRVAEIATKTVTKRPPPPFITSTLQQAASSYCGFSPKRTMGIAQKLYEGINLGNGSVGLITYMRTDSVSIAAEAQQACRDFMTKEYGKEYVPEKPNVYRSRSGAQEAHEAIRPTDVTRTPEDLGKRLEPAALKLYRLIWQRFVASQMTPARIEQRTVKVDAAPPEGKTTTYRFHATSSEVVFPGYMKASGKQAASKQAAQKPAEGAEGENGDQPLPALKEGEPLTCLEWLSDRKETKPPPRFSEATLVRELESNGVGRPSTYAQTISTLEQRRYVKSEKRTLSPTDLGFRVFEMLVKNFDALFNVKFTAAMEDQLDEVEKGDIEWTHMLGDFYGKFEKWLEQAKLPPADKEAVSSVIGVLQNVKEWAPPVQRGKRTYSDENFVESVHKQAEDGEKEVTQRQLDALVKMACRYRDQLPDAERVLTELGFKDALTNPANEPPRETTLRKLEIAKALPLDEKGSEFIESLHGRAAGGRRLTDPQLRALDNVLMAHAKVIENFESLREELGLSGREQVEDNESPILLEAMTSVKAWQEPVKRGRRVFDDQAFCESLRAQFGTKKFLTERQRGALKRMVARYREQIPDFQRVAETCNIRAKGKKKEKEEEKPASS